MVFNYTPINITSFCLHPLDEHLLVYTFKKKKLTFSVNVRVYVVSLAFFVITLNAHFCVLFWANRELSLSLFSINGVLGLSPLWVN